MVQPIAATIVLAPKLHHMQNQPADIDSEPTSVSIPDLLRLRPAATETDTTFDRRGALFKIPSLHRSIANFNASANAKRPARAPHYPEENPGLAVARANPVVATGDRFQ